MKTSISLLLFFTFLCLQLNAQNIEFTKENFPNNKKELKLALKNIDKGDELLGSNVKGGFAQALDYYLMANSFNSNNAALNLKIGICYVNSYYKNLSLPFLENAYRLDSTVSNQLYLYLARACQYNLKFDRALNYYYAYKKTLSPTELEKEGSQINKWITECEAGKAQTQNPSIMSINNLSEKVNSMYDDYSSVVNGDESILAFTSRRSGSTGGKINSYDYLYFEDIYFTYRDQNGNWTAPENPGKPLNGKTNDASVDLSADGKIITLYKNMGGQDVICESRKVDGVWTKPERLSSNINNRRYYQPSATYSKDRKTIYFVSDMKGGFGGSDIYTCKLNENGSWSDPKNLGGVVNSPFNEDAPFLYDDSTLYFSSRGHNTIGGYDIFVSKLRKNGDWTTPVNLGFPLNSAGDDLYLVLGSSGDGYYSSDRQGGMGGLDLYHAKFNLNVDDLLSNIKPVFLWGYVIDEATAEGVISQVDLTNRTENKTIYKGLTDEMGQFTASLPSMKKYELTIKPKDCDPALQKKHLQTGTAYNPGYQPSADDAVPATSITGLIVDEASGKALQFPIEVIDIRNSKLAAKIIPDSTGAFSVMLPSSNTYRFDIMSTGCLTQTVATVDVVNFTDNLVDGINVRLENIYFDFDKSYIRPDAIEIMNRHADLFIKYSNWKVKVIGHTDNMGSETYNKFLSEKRARSVVDYLVSRGAKRNRFRYEGLGYTQPVATNATEEGRQLNRRVEFRILKW